MKKKFLLFLAAGMLVLGLAGCGENQIPDLTDEEMQMVGEYAAITLMRYDASHRSRLVDYSLLMETPEPEVTPEPEATKEPAGMDPVDDTPVIGVDSQTGTSSNIEETLGLPEGISITYLDYALYDNYPEGEDSFTIPATEGKKLLVLSFSVSNASGQDQTIDLRSMEPEFRITVNDDYTRRALMTMLENDLSIFKGSIPAGGSETAVLVIEVDGETANHITAITLKLKNELNSYTIQLL